MTASNTKPPKLAKVGKTSLRLICGPVDVKIKSRPA